jgi:hypothetical protein
MSLKQAYLHVSFETSHREEVRAATLEEVNTVMEGHVMGLFRNSLARDKAGRQLMATERQAMVDLPAKREADAAPLRANLPRHTGGN